jgi:hypothetical protein
MNPGGEFAGFAFIVILVAGVALAFTVYGMPPGFGSGWILVAILIVATAVSNSIKVSSLRGCLDMSS